MMKKCGKSIAAAAAAAVLALNAPAYAEMSYNEDRDAVYAGETSLSGYQCVLIKKDADTEQALLNALDETPESGEDIGEETKPPAYEWVEVDINSSAADDVVYVDQNTDGFDAAVAFMLKGSAAGSYTVYLGGKDKDVTTESFTISEEQTDGKRGMTELEAEPEQQFDGRVGFTIDSVYLPAYKSINVSYTSEENQTVTLSYPLEKIIDTANIDSDVSFGLQINNVPEEAKDSINVSLSKEAQTNE